MTRAKGEGWQPTRLGGNLRRLRKAAGLSQQRLGAMAGVHYTTVHTLETSVHETTWPIALALARALGVSVADFDRDETPP